jgi:hypothetical protein
MIEPSFGTETMSSRLVQYLAIDITLSGGAGGITAKSRTKSKLHAKCFPIFGWFIFAVTARAPIFFARWPQRSVGLLELSNDFFDRICS